MNAHPAFDNCFTNGWNPGTIIVSKVGLPTHFPRDGISGASGLLPFAVRARQDHTCHGSIWFASPLPRTTRLTFPMDDTVLLSTHATTNMKKILLFLLGLVCLACLLAAGYYVVFPAIDRSTCISQVSERIGVNESYESIIQYISLSLTAGMKRNEVEEELNKIGSLEIHHNNAAFATTSSDSIWIKMCSNPLNNFWVNINYNKDNELESFFIDWD